MNRWKVRLGRLELGFLLRRSAYLYGPGFQFAGWFRFEGPFYVRVWRFYLRLREPLRYDTT